MTATQDVSPILQTAFAFWSSKVLLTAVEFGVFTTLGERRLTGAQGADFRKWCGEAGSSRFEVIHVAGASSAAIA